MKRWIISKLSAEMQNPAGLSVLLLILLSGCSTISQPLSPGSRTFRDSGKPGNTSTCFYTYRAIIRSVYDGDTVTADIDLGFHTWIQGEKLRLARINAPELKGDEKAAGLLARNWLRQQILGKNVVIRTIKDKKGKYGRYIAEIIHDGININDALVNYGFAQYRDY